MSKYFVYEYTTTIVIIVLKSWPNLRGDRGTPTQEIRRQNEVGRKLVGILN